MHVYVELKPSPSQVPGMIRTPDLQTCSALLINFQANVLSSKSLQLWIIPNKIACRGFFLKGLDDFRIGPSRHVR